MVPVVWSEEGPLPEELVIPLWVHLSFSSLPCSKPHSDTSKLHVISKLRRRNESWCYIGRFLPILFNVLLTILRPCLFGKKKKLVRGRGSLGKRLLEICRNADLRILNARVSGDSLGRATFYGKAGISVVDFVMCDQTLFSHILNFIVKEPRYLSDHSPLMT